MAETGKLGLGAIIAIGVGGMVGGGIFAVLGLAMQVAGHAVWIALGLGGVLALLTGLSYAHLGLAFRDDGGSFTYIEHAFSRQAALAGFAGWILVSGYAGTLALYATAFGSYGQALLGGDHPPGELARSLGVGVVLVFLGINLLGAKLSGNAEVLIVGIKMSILLVFAAFGLTSIHTQYVLPVFNLGHAAPFIGAALIFVAYEGFELIPNAIDEMRDPDRELRRGLVISILLTTFAYLLVGVVALGNLTTEQVARSGEFVLAVAARPTLGQVGFTAIAIAALLSTASAINATLFGSARLAMVMASEHALPKIFSHRERMRPVPWVAMVALAAVTIAFTLLGNLKIISTFSSATFLLIFTAVNLSAIRLSKRIRLHITVPAIAALLSGSSLVTLLWHTWSDDRASAAAIAAFYLAAIAIETGLVAIKGQRSH